MDLAKRLQNILAGSSPARGTWIEIRLRRQRQTPLDVFPRKGYVDRNSHFQPLRCVEEVVPRKGDVDRNPPLYVKIEEQTVVPRKGDVDRNTNLASQIDWAARRPPQGGRG